MMLPPTYRVFGNQISATSYEELATLVTAWRGSSEGHIVCFSDAHAVVKGHDFQPMRDALQKADIVCPDGLPVALAGRVLYGKKVSRVSGPDFMFYVLSNPSTYKLRHYFFGGAPGVANALVDKLKQVHPELEVVGIDSPPMRPSTEAELQEQLERIREAQPDVVWVGLGAPKQEIWMCANKDALPGITQFGVGAAFDFHSGRVQRAPFWLRSVGMEWAYRVWKQPGRLAKRYGQVVPRFLYLLLVQLTTSER